MNVNAILESAAQAAPAFARTTPRERATALVALAGALDAAGDEIVALGQEETGLTEARLRGELNRTSQQLRLFAEVIVEGAYLDARIDEADPDYAVGPRPDVRRVNVPLGPVLIFAASNFPLAFSVAGGDTAAALAAGNPVILKAHDGHPRLSEFTGRIVTEALTDAGMPEGTFNVLFGREEGVEALRDPRVRAASFTGSTQVGRMLADIAAARPVPIPFYGELGSVNPVVATPQAVAEDAAGLAQAYVASVAGSCGQLCTKPGFLFVPSAQPLREAVVAAAQDVAPHRQLTAGITAGYQERRDAVLKAEGVEVLVEGDVQVDDEGFGWATPTLTVITLAQLEAAGESVLDESFGPLSVIVEYGDDTAALPEVLERLFPGNLTATIHLGSGEDPQGWSELLEVLARTSGRVLFGGWPTGVSVTAAMQHGGPVPATTQDSTSVGTAAIGRFLRAVAFQNAPQAALPPALRDDNPWGIPQRRSAAGLSSSWGELTGRY
ncbi:aldehyde dehydrogenase (NADP(+)) [Aeromicrobium phragmitis]|uniref:Aldehyde dehydrogenase (NADP(+)) n=1 Tax=Aeromicrobium phragmitis TaxID=2478914 RepID=A0A3L8PP14_9ACTN|nr:aldehyde dehydrogenase (NADP(+)) [Aeromicrobium phragmitis]RLV56924.1 aldehyde dehydrogenase (NADP(+)) [Aeromicrobium phragmitis]